MAVIFIRTMTGVYLGGLKHGGELLHTSLGVELHPHLTATHYTFM